MSPTSEETVGPNKWALLCGIDCYLQGTARNNSDDPRDAVAFSNLEGCVRDVNDIYEFLVDKVGVNTKNITKLTSTCGMDDMPLEERALWPTHKNIATALQEISLKSAPGDLLYIHYSGHGIRRDQRWADISDDEGDSLQGTALVMTDVLDGGAYLTGYQLGIMVKQLVDDSKLRVTVVLDSCFSGGGLRDSVLTPRTIEGQLGKLVLAADEDADEALESGAQRDPKNIRKDWLSDPDGCVVITSCGTDQYAGETQLSDGVTKNGVLTYLMLGHLARASKHSSFPSHAQLVDLVSVDLQRLSVLLKVKQTPMIFGNGDYEFFGTARYVQRPFCRVIQKVGKTLVLGVGAVQGVAIGAIYDVLPKDLEPEHEDGGKMVLRARVTRVFNFYCVAELISGEQKVEAGYLAVLRHWALPDGFQVDFRLEDEELRKTLKEELETTPGLMLIDQGALESCENCTTAFVVNVDQENKYEISQNGKRIPRLPAIDRNDEAGIPKLAYVISHISRFQALQQLVDLPRRPQLRAEHFDLDICGDSGAPLSRDQDGDYEVEEDEDISFSVTYNGALRSVWTSLFCFTASWGIVKLDPSTDSGRVANQTIPYIPTRELELSLEVPPKGRDDDPDDALDTFILFASSGGDGPVSWDEICMPSLPVDANSIGALIPTLAIEEPESRGGEITKKATAASEYRWTAFAERIHTFPKRSF